MRVSRSYDQYCPLAQALDLVGERWVLLVVRELLSGPKRFKDLQLALPGIGANLLSKRLKEMEHNGLVAKGVLPPPGVASVYELTERGRALKEALLALVRWGLPLVAEPAKPGDFFRPHWLIHRMLIAFKPAEATGLSEAYEFRVDDEIFHLTVHDGHASGDIGRARNPVLVWESDAEASKMVVALRTMRPEEAVKKGYVTVGNLEVLKRVLRVFNTAKMV